MKQEIRTALLDEDLQIEAYHFKGIMQRFPNHFHEYYVIGFIEKGQRRLTCKNKDFIIDTGDLILLNPHENHACEQIDGQTLDYRCINIQPQIMKKIVAEIQGTEALPHFNTKVIFHSELVSSLKELHLMILEENKDFKKEEILFFLIKQLIEEYSEPLSHETKIELRTEIQSVCEYLENNYTKTITLDELSHIAGLSKYHLLRSFTKQTGISPYSYLETIRINQAKKLLKRGVPLIDVAMQTGFNDQSHFSNFFKKFIGLTPKQYMKIFIEQ
ncbi:helix-turn-helix domain-containing protein [Bacillus massiliigorillae]|uniref:helix-turn-helix domain-containing protein n=1 Tax=Bacillus massiliigorillae TaxID=1243664 RepID=UPI0005A7130A|nr:AraC family transcriptional regulator [Bacillus massiliigorillae]